MDLGARGLGLCLSPRGSRAPWGYIGPYGAYKGPYIPTCGSTCGLTQRPSRAYTEALMGLHESLNASG